MKEEVIDPIFGTQLKKNQFYTWLIFGFHMVSALESKCLWLQYFSVLYWLKKIVIRAFFNSRWWYVTYSCSLPYVIYLFF